MGTFAGHALPGSFFLLVSLWWTYCIFYRYFRSRMGTGPKYRSTVTFPLEEEDSPSRQGVATRRNLPVKSSGCFPCCCCPIYCIQHAESYFKIVVTVIGMLGELATSKDPVTHQFAMGNAQHVTMYAVFGLSGVVDLLMHSPRVNLPENTDYCAAILGFIVEAMLFKFHLHGRTELDISLHTWLLFVVVATIVAGLAEMRFRESVLPALVRTFLTMLQGTWFWQVGSILYLPFPERLDWDGTDPDSVMLALAMFSGHIFAVFSIQFFICILVAWRLGYWSSAQPQAYYHNLLLSSADEMKSDGTAMTHLLLETTPATSQGFRDEVDTTSK